MECSTVNGSSQVKGKSPNIVQSPSFVHSRFRVVWWYTMLILSVSYSFTIFG
jgi:hypothetical protein